MPHKKSKIRLAAFAAGLALAWNTSHAQVRQPAPTGQIPKAYSGAQSAPGATYKPKPTGQIAPEAPGQLGTIVQPAPAAAPTQKVSDVQDLGFEVNSRPSTNQGSVPKVNTSQDPRTMRERYQPEVVQQPGTATQQVQTAQPAQGTAAPATGTASSGTYAPGISSPAGTQTGTQATPGQSSRQATSGQSATPVGQTQSPAVQPGTSGPPKAATQRVDPR
ncbi:hypothetical protein GCM10010967_27880 [Dyadobacter beijingensis]|uniref:Uncharacterized protein n=2 Tax=Dyadobacter beijingensis TaxID=365489 RepID=A0ABQ2HY39_9BACT|nr:hypothetical protein GCM10010967_27880 [Dyadobacter beijingensis]